MGAATDRRGASPVVYFDEPVETLQCAKRRGAGGHLALAPVRFWQEWTLPSLQAEPELIWDDRSKPNHTDLCAA